MPKTVGNIGSSNADRRKDIDDAFNALLRCLPQQNLIQEGPRSFVLKYTAEYIRALRERTSEYEASIRMLKAQKRILDNEVQKLKSEKKKKKATRRSDKKVKKSSSKKSTIKVKRHTKGQKNRDV